MEHFVTTVALVGIVIIVASLLSGVEERAGVPLVGAFILLGALVGPWGLGFVDIHLASPELRVLATLALALVLFSDSVGMNLGEVRERRALALAVLGPGTLLPAIVIAAAAWWLLEVPPPAAVVLGAALASTDPVMLRTVLRSPALPATARVALRLESGMNDALLLPAVVVAMLWLPGAAGGDLAIGRQLLGLFVLGPALGAAIGWVAITVLALLRSRIGVRRDYESLYALGIGFAAYAAAETVGGSGFLAAFSAGLAIAALDVELCDCFLEYGEATAEMLLLLTFVALGTSVIWTGLRVMDGATITFAAVALGARTLVLYPVLGWLGVHGRERRLIALLGPRGLSSLLLVLLPVFAGVPDAERWLMVSCLVVLLSLLAHGTLIGTFIRRKGARARSAVRGGDAGVPDRITIDEVRGLRDRGEPVVLVDARAPRSWAADPRQAAGAVRVPPEDPVGTARRLALTTRGTLVVYCT